MFARDRCAVKRQNRIVSTALSVFLTVAQGIMGCLSLWCQSFLLQFHDRCELFECSTFAVHWSAVNAAFAACVWVASL